jgi:predicted nucleic acid-binding protein
VTRYLLDTNIVSNVIKPEPSTSLLTWMAAQQDDDLYISAMTIAEIHRGILQKSPGKKRNALEAWFTGPEGPLVLFVGRILPFDDRAVLLWAKLMAQGKAVGRPRNGFDMIIAAIAGANDCLLVTDNERDFAGLEVFNPVRGVRISSE